MLLLSFLAGGRFRWDKVALKVVAGPSLVFGTPVQGTLEVDEAAGRLALGGGLNLSRYRSASDWASRRPSVMPTCSEGRTSFMSAWARTSSASAWACA